MKKLLLSAIGLASVFLFLFVFFTQTEEETKAAIIPKVSSLPYWYDYLEMGAISISPDGNIYIAGGNIIDKFDSAGDRVTTWGSLGAGNGQLDDADDVFATNTTVYVFENDNCRIQKFSTAGVYQTKWGSQGAGNGQFGCSSDLPKLAVDSLGNVYTAETNQRIQKFTSTGTYTTEWGTLGDSDSSDFYRPWDIAIDSSDNVYILDADLYSLSSGSYIKKYSSTGVYSTRWAVPNATEGISVDSNGDILAVVTGSSIEKYSNIGASLGSWSDSRLGKHFTVDPSDNVYALEDGNWGAMLKFDSSGTFLRRWASGGSGDGEMWFPYDITTDSSNGDIYLADSGNDRVQVYDSGGNYVRQWGSNGSGDGQFSGARGITFDGTLVYVSDQGNHRIQIFNTAGVYQTEWSVTSPHTVEYYNNRVYVLANNELLIKDLSGNTLYQSGTEGTGDGEFDVWSGADIAVDDSGDIYIADSKNNRIQVFDSTGTYVRQWGTSGTGDGEFSYPRGVAIHGNNQVFVSDSFNDRVQKFELDGTFVTKFGSEGYGQDEFNTPRGLHIDDLGYLYVTDGDNHRVEKYNELFQVQSLASELIALSLSGDDLEAGSTEGRFGTATVRITEPAVSSYTATEMSVDPTSLPGDKIVLASVAPSTVIGGGVAQGWQGDDAEWVYSLPITFPFYGTDYTSVKVGSNGVLCFNPGADCTGWETGFTGIASPIIQPHGMDLATDRAGLDIFITEEASRVIIRWVTEEYDQSDGNVSGGTVEFEVVLYENGNFQFNYGAMPDGYAWTDGPYIGITKGDGIDYLESIHQGPSGPYKTLAGENSVFYSVDRDKTYVDVSADFQGDLDWAPIAASADILGGKVVVDGVEGADGVVSYTLYVPKVDGDDGVHLCPTETTLGGLTTSCTDGYNLGQVEDSVGTTTIASVDYWVVPNAEVKGAFSTGYEPINALGYTVPVAETPAEEEEETTTPVYYASATSDEEEEESEEEETSEETPLTEIQEKIEDAVTKVLKKSEKIQEDAKESNLRFLWWVFVPALVIGGLFSYGRKRE